jgi:hypothetical protein
MIAFRNSAMIALPSINYASEAAANGAGIWSERNNAIVSSFRPQFLKIFVSC